VNNSDAKFCKLATGTVHEITVRGKDRYLEYTFTLENESWCGCDKRFPLWLGDDGYEDYQNGKLISEKVINNLNTRGEVIHLPCRCVVIYHQRDPSFNRIFYIILDNKLSLHLNHRGGKL
ncbi:MAG: hypothetical protein IJU23_01485, partial [Proteobacteria bacterium]|nr:hypothetical protein [Pseudomonadota bacterium]